MSSDATLILEFEGRCMVRQPTDPDPYDERRGVSGYTFAFGDEPDLNRIIYFQPDPAFPLRSHCPPIGVTISAAIIDTAAGLTPVAPLVGATADLLGDPMLENRNWTLTAPGFEPIVPFHFEVAAGDFLLRRLDVLDPANPDKHYMELPKAVIENKGARGLAFEPATVGPATGVYNYAHVARARRDRLAADLDARRKDDPDDESAANAVLIGRIQEIDKGLRAVELGAPNRRTAVHPLVERFGYYMLGEPTEFQDPGGWLPTPPLLGADVKWRIDFWMGGWDFDALSCYAKGQVQIPLS